MDKKNNESYSKGTILIIILLFMFSSKIFNVVWDIGKSLIYIFIIIYCLNIWNPNIAKKIKEILNDIVSTSNNSFLKNILSKVSSFVLGIIKPDETIDKDNNILKKKKHKLEHIAELDNSKVSNLRNLDNEPNNIGRKLA
jgi:hypothetical protein